MNAGQIGLMFLGALLIGIGGTILLLASIGKNPEGNDPVRDRMEGCLTTVFGLMPTLLGFLLVLGALLFES